MNATIEMDACGKLPISEIPTFEEFQASRKWTYSIDADYHDGNPDANGDDYVASPGFLYWNSVGYVEMNDDGTWTTYEWGADYLTSASLRVVEMQLYRWCKEEMFSN